MKNNFSRYKIKIVDSTYRCVSVNCHPITHFIAPDTKPGIQKLYVVKGVKDIFYVGITSQAMSSRFRIGFIDDGHYGYHGYKWKDKIKQAEVLVWTFPEKDTKYSEAIEGELVYFIREKTGKWPKHQMEIHFHSDVTMNQKRAAENILKNIMKKQKPDINKVMAVEGKK